MTVIKKLELTAFGKFINQTIELEGGYVPFIHQNEWGKSTVVDFILFMLYGHPASKKASIEDNRTKRYLPWNGDDHIRGAMEIEKDGGIIRIERRVTASNTSKLTVLDGAGNRLAVTKPGEELFGVDQKTFVRTFLVRQTDIRFESTDDIDTALRNLVTTGDEDVSFEKAIAHINGKITKYRTLVQKRGRLYDLPLLINNAKTQRAELVAKKRDFADKMNELTEQKRRLTLIEAAEKELAEKEAVARGNDAQATVARLNEIDSRIARQQKNLTELVTPLSPLEREHITSVFTQLEAAKRARQDNLDRQVAVSAAIQKAYDSCEGYSMYRQNEDEVRACLAAKPKPNAVLAAAGAAVAVLGAVLGLAVSPVLWALAAVGALLAVLALTVIKVGVKIPPQYPQSQAELAAAFEKYRAARAEADRLSVTRDVYIDAADSDAQRIEKLETDIRSIKESYGIDSLDALAHRVSAAQNRTAIEMSIDSLKKQRADILGGRDEGELAEDARHSDGSGLTRQALSERRMDIAAKKNAVLSRIGELESARVSDEALSDKILELSSTVDALQAELADAQYKNDVYTIAKQALEQAYEKLNNTYSPILAKKIAPTLSVLTGGKYSEVSVDKEFNIRVKAEGEYHELGYFSRGTADAVYFAVRIAMADILNKDCPLILDDPFWSFDNARLENAQTLVEKTAKSRQVLLFAAR